MRIVLSLLLLFPLYGFGIETPAIYRHERISFSDGLPSETVFYTFKKDGFLYVATQRGLCRYDGYLFTDAPDVTHSITSLYADGKQIYFEEAGTGLCKKKDIFAPKSVIQPVAFTDADPDNDHFRCLYHDKRGYIWAADFGHVKYLDTATRRWHNFAVPPGFREDGLIVNYIPQGDDLLLATSAGLFLWEAATGKLSAIDNKKFSSAATLRSGVYLSTENGDLLQYLPAGRSVKIIGQTGIDCNFVQETTGLQSLVCYNTHTLFSRNPETGEQQELFATEDNINHVFFDKETGTFWLSTSNGLVRLQKSSDRIRNLDLPASAGFPLKVLLQDEGGNTWCVTATGNVWRDTGNGQWHKLETKEKINDITTHGSNLYLSARKGVYSVTAGNTIQQLIATDTGIKKTIIAGDKIWLLPLKGAPLVYDRQTLKEVKNYLKPDSDFYATHFINDIACIKDKIWLASWAPKDYGIAFFDTATRSFVPVSRIGNNKALFVGDYFNRITAGRQGVLFSAYGGWNRLAADGRIIQRLHTREYRVANDNIQGIAEDNAGNTWFGCAEGLYQYSPRTGSVIRLSETDGLASNNITHAFFLTPGNRLLIATEKAVQQIDLQKIMTTRLVNRLALSAVRINDSLLQDTPQELKLKEAEAGQVELRFSALNFSDKEKVVYRYRFGGEAWNYLGTDPRLLLVKPVSGSYNITIEAGDNLGNWQQKSLNVRLEVIPPFYKTKWFYGLTFLSVLVLAFLANRYMINQEKQKGELLRRIKSNENHMLRSQMNPHFLFNSLNSINSFILQSKKDEAAAYLTAFSRLMRRILDHSRREHISLREELNTVKIYLDLEGARMDYKFDYSIQVKDLEADPDNILIPPLILQPFLENAIWHGISHKKGKGFIDIIIMQDKEISQGLLIKIIDDGVGRAAAARFEGNKTHKSQGLGITTERLCMSDPGNEVHIKDLEDETGIPSGTMVILKIAYQHD